MNVLIVAIHYPVCSARYAADALARLGHEVRTVGPCTGNELWGLTVDAAYTWEPAPPEDGWAPDLVLTMDSAIAATGVPEGVPHVVYGVDNHVRDYRHGAFDHLFLAHGGGLRMGEPDVTWLPCGYDPVAFTPGKPWAERSYDAALIGVLYGPRAEWLYGLLEGTRARIAYGTGVIYDGYAAVYQDARISLVRSAAQDVAQRVWETAAMGCLVVMDWCPDAAALGLVDGENCLIYTAPQEAVDRVRWALAHPDEAEAIAAAGQAWAAPGTWDARLQVIVEWAQARSGQQAEKATRNHARD